MAIHAEFEINLNRRLSSSHFHVVAVEMHAFKPEKYLPMLRRLPMLKWINVPYLSGSELERFQRKARKYFVSNDFRQQ